MDRLGRGKSACCLAACLAVLLAGNPVGAQFNLDNAFKIDTGKSLSGAKVDADVAATFTADPAKPGEAELRITITVPEGLKTYGQDSTAPKKTEIKVADVPGAAAIGDGFAVDREPKIEHEPSLGKKVGSYTGSVTFSRRYQLDPAANPEPTLEGKISFLVCRESCTPLNKEFVASLAPATTGASVPSPDTLEESSSQTDAPAFEPAADAPANSLKFGYRIVPLRLKVEDHVRLQFEVGPANAKPGETVTLAVTMDLNDHWHTYSMQPGKGQFENPTEISLGKVEGLVPEGEWTESPAAKVKESDGHESRYHTERVTWRHTFRRTDAPAISISGDFTYQICDEKQCLNQKTVPFALGAEQNPELMARATAVTESFISTPDTPINISVAGTKVDRSLAGWMLVAFLGGLLLNVMPCVLPVLAIKILSFVQQAGESRRRVLALNLSYTAGVLAVFWLLATLAVFASIGTGDIFQRPWFLIATVVLLYVVGLNLLGVFEVTLPGIVGQAAGSGHREGLSGAFMTGVFTTLLATPCTIGPIASVITWSLTQPPSVVYLIFGMMALGMASPYLLLGMVPKLVDRLPRPGMWMVRFKQLSAFAMFGAAIFFVRGVDQRDLLPLLTGILGISLGLWMVGQMYDRETPVHRKNWVRGSALTLTALMCSLGWWMHREATMKLAHHMPWETFSSERFIQLRKEGKPMLVDFTADWCAICKANEAFALNTIEAVEFVKNRKVVALMADWTDENAEIKGWLDKFKSNSVPLTLIVPPDPNQPVITLTGPFTKSQLLERLNSVIPEMLETDVKEAAAAASPPVERTAMSGSGGD
jgi:suppressor for copper-sensitivity B